MSTLESKPKVAGAVALDVRAYAKLIGLPPLWADNAEVKSVIGSTGESCSIFYNGERIADYNLDILGEIESKQYHRAIPQPPDPLVAATECALSQPKDSDWRRFKHLLFQRCDVMFVNNVDKAGRENGESFVICFKGGRDLVCGNEKNYQNTGMSTCEFFIQHVMELSPERHT